ncbi:MAG: TetR/AcrR family transcriptional regulator [Marinosulfonomonas sp.]
MSVIQGTPRIRRDLQPSKSALTRSRILDAGHEFLATRPFREMSVGALMKNTEVSRPTFYQYFKDVHELMEALLEEVKSGILEGAQAWFANEGEPLAELQKSLSALVEVGVSHGSILKAVADAAPGDARLEAAWNTFLASFDDVVASQITHHQSLGITPKFDPLPVAYALNRMDAGVLIHAFGTQHKADKAEVLSAITQIWISTLYPDYPESRTHREDRVSNKT